jgi:hypothetical protein
MDNLLYFTNIEMTDVNELELPTIDPEMESEAQAIANYEDELAEFVNLYKKDRGFRESVRTLASCIRQREVETPRKDRRYPGRIRKENRLPERTD